LEPLVYRPQEASEEVLLCGCKRTGTPPFCDGTHNNLPGGYRADVRSEDVRDGLRRAHADDRGIARLDGRCYVVSPAPTTDGREAPFRIRKLIGRSLGAEHQSLFEFEAGSGTTPTFSAGSADVILFVARGSATVEISGRTFEVRERDGLHVRPGEWFRAASPTGCRLFVSTLPAAESLTPAPSSAANFDNRFPDRVRGVDEAIRSEMGPRYFQMLVDSAVGLQGAAQFIGHIPPSRAEMHRHLYEEALMVLSGQGILWNEESRADVTAGDVIFLPRKHAHSLECTHSDGMDVAGIIYPGDNPSLNY
jgi:mannose-6-phosphate isomerase-like protein (cupin superfamily)